MKAANTFSKKEKVITIQPKGYVSIIHLLNNKTKKQICFWGILFLSFFYSTAIAEDFDVQLLPSIYAGGYNITCHGAATGSINLFISGGNAPYTYSWQDGSTLRNRSNLTAGYYRVVVSSSNGSSVKREIILKEPELFQLGLHAKEYAGGTQISENGASNGSIEPELLGGVPPYTFLWSDGSTKPNLPDLSAGMYSLQVNDATNCVLHASITLVEPSALHVVSISSPNLLNTNFNTAACKPEEGTVFLSVAGGTQPYKYRWSNGAFTQNLIQVAAGDYSVIVSDANANEVSASITLLEAPLLTADFVTSTYSNGKNTSCASCMDATITAIPTSGVAPFTYSWNTGHTSATIQNLPAGEYSIKIQDAAACILERTILLHAPERADWTMNGNSNTNPQQHFIGTSDSSDLVFKANGIEKFRLVSGGATQFQDEVKLNALSGSSGMLFLDTSGRLLNSEVGAQQFQCSRAGFPIWNSNEISNSIFTCSPTKVGIGVSAFPNASQLHVNGMSLFDGNVQIGNDQDSFDLEVKGEVRIASLAVNSVNSIVQVDANGLLKSMLFPSNDSINYWKSHSNGKDVYRDHGKVGIANTNPQALLDVMSETADTSALLCLSKSQFSADPKSLLLANASGEFRIGCDGNSSPWQPAFYITPLLQGDNYIAAKVGVATKNPTGQFQVGHRMEKVVVGSFYSGAPYYNANYVGFNAGRDFTSAQWTVDNDGPTNSGAAVISSSVDGELRFITLGSPPPGEYEPGDNFGPTLYSDNDILQQIKMVIKPDGKIGIGQPSNYSGNFKLYVKGGIISDKVKVAVDGSPEWMDVVFEKNYPLRTIRELEKYIHLNKHLPEIPTTEEVKRDGIDLGMMQKKFLQKIEELSLYIIQQEKRIEALENSKK